MPPSAWGGRTLDEKFAVFARGAANENVLTMLMIYILAGAFSTVAKTMGGVDATVNLGLSIIPVQLLIAGVFVISAFLGTATGTSVGTITALVPIAVGLASESGLSVPMMLGACAGGAMFGDNLSMISDTTIAATRTQGVALKDKFRVNFYHRPARRPHHPGDPAADRPGQARPSWSRATFELIKVLPYRAGADAGHRRHQRISDPDHRHFLPPGSSASSTAI